MREHRENTVKRHTVEHMWRKVGCIEAEKSWQRREKTTPLSAVYRQHYSGLVHDQVPRIALHLSQGRRMTRSATTICPSNHHIQSIHIWYYHIYTTDFGKK